MVTAAQKQKMHRSSLVLMDLVGGASVLACLGVFVWLTCLREGLAGREIGVLTGSVTDMRKDLAALRGALDNLHNVVEAHRDELAVQGKLPGGTPIDEDLHALSQLAAESGIALKAIDELGARSYPGLRELRYTIEAEGTLADLMRFFKAIETANLWADISYVEVASGPSRATEAIAKREARLTVSLFSATDPVAADAGEDGKG